MRRYEFRAQVRDLLGQNQNALQTSEAGSQVIRADLRGRSFSFGLTARL